MEHVPGKIQVNYTKEGFIAMHAVVILRLVTVTKRSDTRLLHVLNICHYSYSLGSEKSPGRTHRFHRILHSTP